MSKTQESEKTYLYTAYGLNILSCIPCPELSLSRGMPDVTIRYGAVPDSLASAKEKGIWYQATPEQVFLSIGGVARYLVTGGKEILIDRAPDAGDDEVRLFLLGSAFGAMLYQRGLLPLHGSAIEVDTGCVAILGDSGMGKSTLAGAFRKRGYRIIADDICVVRVDGGSRPIILPGYPQLKLWADTASRLDEKPESLPRVNPNIEKYFVTLQEGFCQKPLPLHRLYVLNTANSIKFDLMPLNGIEKLTEIIKNTYRFQFLEGMREKESHFKLCVEVAKHTSVSRVTRPRELFLLNELAELLEEDFSNNNFRQDLQD